jgi:type VI secretion system protein ImpM
MRRGLFGKTQTKRDFIAPGAPREFLSAWEPWVQTAISSSRLSLGDGWRDAYLTMPIWRFWLGSDICGATAIGAVMSSMDGVGRYFPLTLVFVADDGDELLPPEIAPYAEWFGVVENFLLGTLDTGRRYEEITAELVALPEPFVLTSASSDSVIRHKMATIVKVGDAPFSEIFGAARRADCCRAHAACTFWWTEGGPGYPRLALAAQRMPDPSLFASLITGRFEADAE